MVQAGAWLALNGHGVVSGNAEGSDQAFAGGANQINPGLVTLCLPWRKYNEEAIVSGNKLLVASTPYEEKLAEQAHPAWANLKQSVRRLMFRNATIINRTFCTIAYLNPNKKGGGGTGHGYRISQILGHEVLLLNTESTFKDIEKFIDKEFQKMSQRKAPV